MFQMYIDRILADAPIFRKRLYAFLENTDTLFWKRADDFAERLTAYLHSEALSIDFAVRAYLSLCKEASELQFQFARTGQYPCADEATAYREVYTQVEKMRAYMVALALTQFLWKNHYLMYDFFIRTLESLAGKVKTHLEIGPGHALYLATSMNYLNCRQYKAIDISPGSLELAHGIIPFFTDQAEKLVLTLQDAHALDETERYDLIVMGEVIEHLENPQALLTKLARVLHPGSVAFFTTCANCAMVDHIYLFHNAQQMRDIFHECGFTIHSELLLPVEERDTQRIEEMGVPTNYAVHVVRKA